MKISGIPVVIDFSIPLELELSSEDNDLLDNVEYVNECLTTEESLGDDYEYDYTQARIGMGEQVYWMR